MKNNNMKKVGYAVLAVVVIFLIVSYINGSKSGGDNQGAGVFSAVTSLFSGATGNGAPSGAHYNLNIIGVGKGKTPNMTGGSGHRIFVGLGGKTAADTANTQIALSLSTDGTFKVVDANGTDDGRAEFMLPAPGTYSIWARSLGKPGGQAKVTTCAEYTYTDEVTGQTVTENVCSTSNEIFMRDKGKSSFKNVTPTLTTIDLDASNTEVITACGGTTVSLFNPCLEGYFWNYDNNGLRVLQLRFYKN
jgi:hypothetical protein